MRAGPLGLRLFLEGVEVPVVSAQVSMSPSQPAVASIQVVATDAALELKPRTLVHLFYLDADISAEDAQRTIRQRTLLTEFQDTPRGDQGKQTLNRLDVSEHSYKLLFTGEIIGLSFQKTPMSRSLVFQCMDLSSYWDICYQWFADWSVQGTALTDKSHMFVGAGSGLFDNIASGTRWVISNILLTKPRNVQYRDCKGLLGGMVSLLETVGGLRGGRGSGAGLRGVNDFFTVADRRYNFLGMVGAIEADKTSVQMYKAKAFRHWLQNGMSSLGNLISFRDILRQVGRYIYHDVYPNPAAYLAPSKEKKVTWTSAQVKTSTVAGGLIEAALTRITEYRSAVISLAYATADTRTATEEGNTLQAWGSSQQMVENMEKAAANLFEAIKNLQDAVDTGEQTKEFAPQTKRKIREALNELKRGVKAAKLGPTKKPPKIVTKVEDLRGTVATKPVDKGAAVVQLGALLTVADRASSLIADLLKSKRYSNTRQTGEHLYNQLILPECFWAPPPRCNVIFPDQYTEFSYSRNFMREVTRLSCQGGIGILGRHSKVLGRFYFSPTIKDAQGRSLQTAMRQGGRILLPHEIHSGIVPKFEWVTQGHRWGVRAAQGQGVKTIPYIQRLANYQFFFHRWAARTISMRARFNPRLVLGFSSLIIDRGGPSKQEQERMKEVFGYVKTPTQYLGKIGRLTHAVNQSGGSTGVELSHCRTHKGADDEFLGILKQNVVTLYDTKVFGDNTSFSPIDLLKKDTQKGEGLVQYRILDELKTKLYGTKPTGNIRLGSSTALGSNAASGVQVSEDAVTNPDGSRSVKVSSEDPPGAVLTAQLAKGQMPTIRGEQLLVDETINRVGKILEIKITGVSVISNADKKRLGLAGLDSSLKVPDNWAVEGAFVGQLGAVEGSGGLTSFKGGWFIPSKIEVHYLRTEVIDADKASGGSVPIEDVMMPGWYHRDVWGSKAIGEKVYGQLLGCGSITDDHYLSELGFEESGGTGVGMLQAIDGLSYHYGSLKEKGLSIHDFIRTYTYRPIASLPDVLGGKDETGNPVEGFHRYAFGDYNVGSKYAEGEAGQEGNPALEGLFDKDESGKIIVPLEYRGGGKVKQGEENIPKYLDPRGNARSRVRAYMAELNFSRGLKGS